MIGLKKFSSKDVDDTMYRQRMVAEQWLTCALNKDPFVLLIGWGIMCASVLLVTLNFFCPSHFDPVTIKLTLLLKHDCKVLFNILPVGSAAINP